MIHQSSSSPLIKGIDGIVNRYPNEVSYSALNGTKIESGKHPENVIQQKYRKCGLKNMENQYYMKEGKYTGKNGKLMEPDD